MKILSKKTVITIMIVIFGLSVLTVTMTVLGSDQDRENNLDTTTNEEFINSQSQDFGGLLVKTLLSLTLVVALMVLLIFGLRWLKGKAGGGAAMVQQMRVYGSVPLGPKKALYLVQVFNKVLVLGVTDANITLLSEITDEKEVGRLLQSSNNEAPGANKSFATYLANLTKKTTL